MGRFGGVYAQQEYSDIRHGNNQYKKESFDKAEIDYRRALDKNQESFQAHYNLGNSLFRQDKYEEAAAEFAEAAKHISPKEDKVQYAETMHNLGNAMFATQQYDKAVAAYQNALRCNPKDNDTRYNMVKAMQLLQQQQQQQQQDQNQNQNQDQNQQQQQQNEEQNNNQDQQQQENQENQMDKETAEQILQALEQDEQETQEKMQRQQGSKKRVEKDW